MRKKEEIKRDLDKETNLLKDKVVFYQFTDEKTGKVHTEIRLVKESKELTKGFVVYKTNTGAHNAELYGSHVKKIMDKFFVAEKGKIVVLMGELQSHDHYFKMKVRNNQKHILFLINGKVVFTINKVRIEEEKGNKYEVSAKSVETAFKRVEKELKNIYETNVDDFNLCKKAIGLIDELYILK